MVGWGSDIVAYKMETYGEEDDEEEDDEEEDDEKSRMYKR